MSNIKINELPLQVPPQMAACIGLNETIILQLLLCWTQGGEEWAQCSHSSWAQRLPFWSLSTIRRTLSSLERQGLLHIKYQDGNPTYYRPDREALASVMRNKRAA